MARTSRATPPDEHLLSSDWKRQFNEQLMPWFRRHQRDLPWRKSRDPYRVWISEIMLQQTQVATVIPYFNRFVESFPDASALANADEQEVLRHWEGLGYYRRARQLHAAAKVIVTQHRGQFPQTLADIASLPGIGRYTSGAVASIALGIRAPILEANTIRLFSRLIAQPGDPTTSMAQHTLWQLAEQILPTRNVGLFNQALMELGSLVCTPKAPRCDVCPARDLCKAFQQGKQDEIPGAKRKPNFEDVREAAVVVWNGDHVLVRQCEPGERWAGLWDFSRFPLTAVRGKPLQAELAAKVCAQTGVKIHTAQKIATIKHGVTRFRITLDCFRAETMQHPTAGKASSALGRWILPEELDTLPLSTTGRKLSRIIQAGLTAK